MLPPGTRWEEQRFAVARRDDANSVSLTGNNLRERRGADDRVAEFRELRRPSERSDGKSMEALVSMTTCAAMFVVSRYCLVYSRSVRASSFQSTYFRSSPGR